MPLIAALVKKKQCGQKVYRHWRIVKAGAVAGGRRRDTDFTFKRDAQQQWQHAATCHMPHAARGATTLVATSTSGWRPRRKRRRPKHVDDANVLAFQEAGGEGKPGGGDAESHSACEGRTD